MAKKSFIWIIFTIIILITLHLKILTFSDFDVPFIYIMFIIWFPLTYSLRVFSIEGLLFTFCLIIFPLLYLPILQDLVEFFKTYFQYLISVPIFFFFAYRKNSKIKLRDFLKAIQVFQVILLITVIIQFITIQLLGIDTLNNIWGSFQMYHQLERDPWTEVQRMKAYYLEPSYLAFVIINCYWYVLSIKNTFSWKNFTITLLIVALSASSFGILAFTLLSLNYYILNRKRWIQYPSYILVIIMVVFFWDVLAPVVKLDVLFSGEVQYSSTFMRLVAPLWVLDGIWNDGYIFGAGFGQYERYYEAIIAGEFGEKGISNGIYLVLAYFGIIGLLLYLFGVFKYFKTNSTILKSFILLTFLNLTNSGAIFTVQFIFLAFLLPSMVFQLKSRENNFSTMNKVQNQYN